MKLPNMFLDRKTTKNYGTVPVFCTANRPLVAFLPEKSSKGKPKRQLRQLHRSPNWGPTAHQFKPSNKSHGTSSTCAWEGDGHPCQPDHQMPFVQIPRGPCSDHGRPIHALTFLCDLGVVPTQQPGEAAPRIRHVWTTEVQSQDASAGCGFLGLCLRAYLSCSVLNGQLQSYYPISPYHQPFNVLALVKDNLIWPVCNASPWPGHLQPWFWRQHHSSAIPRAHWMHLQPFGCAKIIKNQEIWTYH